MKAVDILPQKIRDLYEVKYKEEILYCVQYDLNEDNEFIDGWLAVTRQYFVCIENGHLLEKICFEDYSSFEVINYTNSNILIANQDKEIVRFTYSYLIEFEKLIRILNGIKNQIEIKTNVKSKNNDSKNNYLAFLSLVKWIKNLIKPYRNMFYWSICLAMVLSVMSLIQPWIYRVLIDEGVLKVGKNTDTIFRTIFIYFVYILVNIVFSIRLNIKILKMGEKIAKDLRESIFKKLQTLSLSFIDSRTTGDLMNRITLDTNIIQRFITEDILTGIRHLVVLVAVLGILIVFNWKMAILIMLTTPITLYMQKHFKERIKFLRNSQMRAYDYCNTVLQDILNGISIVKAFGAEKKEIEHFSQVSKKIAKASMNIDKEYSTIQPIIQFIVEVGDFFLLFYGAMLVSKKQIQVGELLQYSQYARMVYKSLKWGTGLPKVLANTTTSAVRILDILNEEIEVNEKSIKHKIKGDINVQNVTFGYNAHKLVLKDLNLTIKNGEMIGVVGYSGAGKTTLINLLMRLYSIKTGMILIDENNLEDIQEGYFREQLGVVLQETFLFSGSIGENISYSKTEATLEEIVNAAKIANAHDFIMQLPDGYDTVLGENGRGLSGGERQRIAIARAVLNNPRILIFDEATASLDTETEYLIQEAIEQVVKNRTAIIIAHRLSTLRNANRLIVLDNGKIVEMGTHNELMLKRGKYYSLVNKEHR